MSSKLYTLSWVFFLFVASLHAQIFHKSILTNDILYTNHINKDNLNYIKIINTKNNLKADSIFIGSILTHQSGALFSNPVAWDIYEDKLYVIRVYEDNQEMNYAQLLMFDLNEWRRLNGLGEDSASNYLNAFKRFLARTVEPVEKYAFMIRFKDQLRGKVFFDVVCDAKSLQVYVYLDSIHRLEAWTFTRFPKKYE
jgi:hypothetical protein